MEEGKRNEVDLYFVLDFLVRFLSRKNEQNKKYGVVTFRREAMAKHGRAPSPKHYEGEAPSPKFYERETV